MSSSEQGPQSLEHYQYIGDELDLFAHAINWKRYWYSKISPYLGQHVLEVGAGIGGTTAAVLAQGRTYELWHCLEPDVEMANVLAAKKAAGEFPEFVQVTEGTLNNLDQSDKYDSILYIDVLEHIEHDAAEVAMASQHLRKDGYLIVLSPAHQSLYSEFDKAIGHFRRYSRASLASLTPDSLTTEAAFYLDSIGQLTSLANRYILRAPLPTLKQILFWDRVLLPLARVVDPLVGRSLGRSVIYIWRKR